MATISSLGVGSGLDANSIVTQLMTLERKPLNLLQEKENAVNAKISAFGSLRSLLETLRTTANTLGTPNKLAAFAANSSSTEVASATASSTARAGSFSVNVQRLATAHKIANTTAVAGTSTATIGAGTFTITSGSGTPVTVTLQSATATLGDLRDAINGSDAGVSANIVTGKNGNDDESRLVLTAKETGQTITTSTTYAGLSNFQTVGGPHAITTNTAFSGTGDLVGKGTLAITVGSTSTNVAMTNANATLQDVANAINGTSGVGVTASIVTDTTGTRLKLVSTDPNKLVSYTAVDNDATDGIEFTKLRGFSTLGSQPQVPQSALVEIDGQVITSASNSLTSAISGVTLNLSKVGTTTLTIARNQDTVSTAVNDFVKNYNDLNTKIRSLTAYDATNKKGSTLTGDSTVRSVQNQVASVLTGTPGTPSGTYSTLMEIGITTGNNGSLSINTTTLKAAIDKDFASVSNVLNRYGNALYEKIGNFTNTGGLLAGKTDSLSSMITDYNRQQESIQLRLDAIEKRYRSQFTALDTAVASMQRTSTYLAQQIARLS